VNVCPDHRRSARTRKTPPGGGGPTSLAENDQAGELGERAEAGDDHARRQLAGHLDELRELVAGQRQLLAGLAGSACSLAAVAALLGKRARLYAPGRD